MIFNSRLCHLETGGCRSLLSDLCGLKMLYFYHSQLLVYVYVSILPLRLYAICVSASGVGIILELLWLAGRKKIYFFLLCVPFNFGCGS